MIYPDAKVESHTTGFPKKRYYLIRRKGAHMYMAEGETSAKAWQAAAERTLHNAKLALNPEKVID